MAPKVGLEPTTHRLTADCSTIELLWMPTGGALYKAFFSASTDNLPHSNVLAMRTIKRAARGLHQALDRRPAFHTGPPPAVVNQEPLLVKPGVPARSSAVIKKPVARAGPGVIQRHGGVLWQSSARRQQIHAPGHAQMPHQCDRRAFAGPAQREQQIFAAA